MKETRYGRLYEYQCHVGHRFGLKTMIAEKTDAIERMMSAALAQTEELTGLLREAEEFGDSDVSQSLTEEIEMRKEQAQTLRELLEGRVPRKAGTG
jgi:hypothetical protein